MKNKIMRVRETRPLLTVIIPFRADPKLPYLMARLEDQCSSFKRRDDVEFMVVDSGSPIEYRDPCHIICKRHGIRYLYHDSEGSVFSIGAARDYGASFAEGRAITFLDVDLRVAADFWDRLLILMKSYGISKYKKRFLAIPCLYLTADGTEEFEASDPNVRALDFYLRWMHGDSGAVQNLAPCSSVMIVDRLHYLSVGGHRPEFRGHGYEDFELYHRLSSELGQIPRPDDYYHDSKSWDIATYRGFRSQFSLFGRPALLANLMVFHLWHPRPKSSSFYGRMAENREIWLDFFKDFDKTRFHPEPIIDSSALSKKVLFFGKQNTNAARVLKDVIPLLGQLMYMSEYDLIDQDGLVDEVAFKKLIEGHGIGSVLFANPYGNPARLQAYEWCRRNDFPYLVFERGAFPDSWFLDPRGFNADSESYRRELWDMALTEHESESIKAYVERLLTDAPALESQGSRLGGEGLGSRLGIGGKKVLFVPLQRPSDTVIQHLRGNLPSYDAFIEFIDEAAGLLKRAGWVVLCKKHPLETEAPELKNALYVPNETNFLDLLELSDRVALINSGIGLYAMAMGKPCYIFGKAFYSIPGVNREIASLDVDGFFSDVTLESSVNMGLAYRFLYYLVFKFYSFGVPRTALRKERDGSMRNLTVALDFYKLRVPGVKEISYDWDHYPMISTSAPIFERYQLFLHEKRRKISKAAPVSIAHTPASKIAPSAVSKIENKDRAIAISKAVIVNRKTNLSERERRAAKLAKLRRDPHAFFRDSRIAALRPLKIFWRNKQAATIVK